MATDPERGNAAILYHPEGYTTTSSKLMGRHAAGEGFLQGFFRHAEADCFYAYAGREEHYNEFRQNAVALTGNCNTVWIPQSMPERISEVGALYLPGPDLAPHAWVRSCRDPSSYSITGVTHTICSDRVMDSLGTLLVAPVERWDAVICTSRVVKSSIVRLLEGYGEYLAKRLQAPLPAIKPELPIIPLGVDCNAFVMTAETASARQRLREKYGVGTDDILVLYMGRLSYHAKAHPLPMYMGLEAAARTSKRKIWLFQAGWFPNNYIEQEFIRAAQQLCPSVRMIIVDGRKPGIRRNIWFAADIFISLSDNIQETFGITPIEAMSAGLPVVVTDWDGYRDTVKEGETGFLVPTTMPAENGEELAWRFLVGLDTYDRYIGYASQNVAVDINATTQALTTLVRDSELRKRMGDCGRERARKYYDWSVIIHQYQELWTELTVRRKKAQDSEASQPYRTAPLRPDPFWLFSDYPTRVINPETSVSFLVSDPEETLHHLLKLNMNRYAATFLLSSAEVAALFKVIEARQGIILVNRLLEEYPLDRHSTLQRTLAWLAKLGIIKLAD